MARKSNNNTVTLWTLLLYVQRCDTNESENLVTKGFALPGEPTLTDDQQNPIQRFRFNDGIRTVYVLVYGVQRVTETYVQGYLEAWRKGRWVKLSLKKGRTNNAITKP